MSPPLQATLRTEVPLPLTMSRLDLAHHLRYTANHLDKLVAAGRMPPPIGRGKNKRWLSSTILAWIEAGMPSCPSPSDQR